MGGGKMTMDFERRAVRAMIHDTSRSPIQKPPTKTVQNTSEKRDNFIGNKSADKTFRKPKPQPGEISAEMPEEL